MASRNRIRGFFDGRGSADVRASKRAKDSGVNVVGGGRPSTLAIKERMSRMSGIENTMLPIVERKFPKCSMSDIMAKNEE